MAKAQRWSLDPASPRMSKQTADIPKQIDCAQIGPTI